LIEKINGDNELFLRFIIGAT